MTGSAAHQVSLLCCLERYERGENLALWFPALPWLGQEADKRHDALFEAAMHCGFEPGGRHSHMTCWSWSAERSATIQRVLPNHVRER